MRIFLFFFCLIQTVFGTDYDCLFVGSSPIALFEAIYQHTSGKKVLIVEQANECGGAWKSIDICGISHADLGCHQIGSDPQLKEFLEIYGGCSLVSLDHPLSSADLFSGNGYYFSKGCYELVNHLEQLIEKIGIPLLLNHRVDSIFVDLGEGHAIVKINGESLSTKKVFHTSMSSFTIENSKTASSHHISKYPHLYLLIQDPTPPKFSYMGYGFQGAFRAMNLTHFVDLAHTGRQLVVIQVTAENMLTNGIKYLEDLKKRNFLDPSAYLLEEHGYTYEILHNSHLIIDPEFRPYFEMIDTASFAIMKNSANKWAQVLRPYRDIIP